MYFKHSYPRVTFILFMHLIKLIYELIHEFIFYIELLMMTKILFIL